MIIAASFYRLQFSDFYCLSFFFFLHDKLVFKQLKLDLEKSNFNITKLDTSSIIGNIQ